MQQNWAVLKFGGSSVGEPSHWRIIAKVTQQRIQQGFRPFLVLSALKNVSNALEALLHQALAGVYPLAINRLKDLHLGFASKLGIDATETLAPWFNTLESFCEEIHTSGKITPKLHAQVLSIGELLSTSIGAQYLAQQSLPINWMDARQLLTSEDNQDEWHHYTSAHCNFQPCENLKNTLNDSNSVVITQGFIAADKQDATVLLGREGSDTSAAYFGAKLQAARIEIWTDVPGIFSANPREISNACQLPSISYQQAQNMAQLGAKVLHPRAIQPAQQNHIPLFVKCTQLPLEAGSKISADSQSSSAIPIIAITSETDVTWVHVEKQQANKELHQHNSAQFTKAANLMASCGFDLIISFDDEKNIQGVFRYANSDQQQPDDQQLKIQLQAFFAADLEVKSGLTLLSLVGNNNEPGWMNNALDIAKQQFQSSMVDYFIEAQQGIICFIAHSKQSTELAKQLHYQLIEANTANNLYGQKWKEFQL